ncbi:MAG: CARDB domain-containing protein [Planctomycetota bacterium]|nr:CARDB domain-containing protein [Planctomycetota bacterium]
MILRTLITLFTLTLTISTAIAAEPFVLFWCPQPIDLKNATHITPQVWTTGDAVGKEQHPDFNQRDWLKKGITPLRWMGGYCYKTKTEDEFVDYWSGATRWDYRGIAIDEFGSGKKELDERMGRALVRAKRKCPKLSFVVWHAGPLTESLGQSYRDGADLVMLEKYFGASGYEKRFAEGVERARRAKILHKTVFALGINDKDKPEAKQRWGEWANSPEILEAQIKWIRDHAPEMPGIAFYASNASPEMVRSADELVGRYWSKKPLPTNVAGAELFTNPPLPIESQEVTLTFRAAVGSSDPETAKLEIVDAQGKMLVNNNLTLTKAGDTIGGVFKWTPVKNGLYLATVSGADIEKLSIKVPVLDQTRQLDFAWYRPFTGIRWATVVTSSLKDRQEVSWLRKRGIKALVWKGGSTSNYKGNEQLGKDAIIAKAKKHYTVPSDFSYDGFGIDEFGGYTETGQYKVGVNWLRGLSEARQVNPKDTYIAAWHCGPMNDEWLGIYRKAANILLAEAYEMHYVPHDLGTENIYQDLLARCDKLRTNNMFTRVYGATCKAVIAIDVGGRKGTYSNLAEMEQIFRFIRRQIPEMRGIGLYNGSCATEQVARGVQQLCFDYFIKPVVTFQAENLWLDDFNDPSSLVAAVSNIGGMDSGPVTIELKVDGKVVGTKKVASIPAGYSRLDNRALVKFDWKPDHKGTYRIEAEIIDAPSSTVLESIIRCERYVSLSELDKINRK